MVEIAPAPLNPQAFYSIAGPRVVARLFEDELTLINLESGEYFAAGGAAPDVWDALSSPVTRADLAAIIISRYAGDPSTIETDLDSLCRQFHDHGLIVESEPRPPVDAMPVAAQKPWPGVWLESYGDMKELLLLDPIHDVGEGAWPPVPGPSSP